MPTLADAPITTHPARLWAHAGQAPGHLLVMVCDAALRFLDSARDSYAAGDPARAAADVAQAQRIVLEMMGALDRAVAPDMTDALARLYQRVFDRLSDAIHEESPTILGESRIILAGVRNAWANAARTARRPLGHLDTGPLMGERTP